MNYITRFPHWILLVFSLFCLYQVRLVLEEIEEQVHKVRNTIHWMGTQFTILPNRSFIIDESLHQYGCKLDMRYQLN